MSRKEVGSTLTKLDSELAHSEMVEQDGADLLLCSLKNLASMSEWPALCLLFFTIIISLFTISPKVFWTEIFKNNIRIIFY